MENIGNQHRIYPRTYMQTSTLIDRKSKNDEYQSIEGATHDVHSFPVAMGCLDVVDSQRNEGKARYINQNVDNTSHTRTHCTEAKIHLHEIMHGQHDHGSEYHPARTFIAFVQPSDVKVCHTQDKSIDEHNHKTCKLQ